MNDPNATAPEQLVGLKSFMQLVADDAPVVRIRNHTDLPFLGWHRTTIDKPLMRSGIVTSSNGTEYLFMLGRQLGKDTRALDIYGEFAAQESVQLNLALAKPAKVERAPLPADLAKWLGGPVTCGGFWMNLVEFQPDGAGWSSHWRARVFSCVVDLWLLHYADQCWCSGEAMVTCSDPRSSLLSEPAGAEEFRVRIGDALIGIPGKPYNAPLVDDGESFADGQARAMPLTAFWPRHSKDPRDWANAAISWVLGINSVGISRLAPYGNPLYPRDFDAEQWARERFDESVRRLHTFEPAMCGPHPFSGVTGAQEDQLFVRGEALL